MKRPTFAEMIEAAREDMTQREVFAKPTRLVNVDGFGSVLVVGDDPDELLAETLPLMEAMKNAKTIEEQRVHWAQAMAHTIAVREILTARKEVIS